MSATDLNWEVLFELKGRALTFKELGFFSLQQPSSCQHTKKTLHLYWFLFLLASIVERRVSPTPGETGELLTLPRKSGNAVP